VNGGKWTFSTDAVSSASAMIHIGLMATPTEEQLRTALRKSILVGKELHIIQGIPNDEARIPDQ